MHKRVMDSTGVPADELARAVEQLVRHVRLSTRAGGLSTAAASALGRLEREGPYRLSELARSEGVSQPNMTQLVGRMERAGLVSKGAAASDARGVLVEITETGRTVCGERRAERAHALHLLVEQLSDPEQQAVRIALPALARAIRDRRAET